MKRNNLCFLNIIVGIVMISITIIFDLKDDLGLALFLIGFLILISGIILNNKLRRLIMEFLTNFI